jgi:hypothetical protein
MIYGNLQIPCDKCCELKVTFVNYVKHYSLVSEKNSPPSRTHTVVIIVASKNSNEKKIDPLVIKSLSKRRPKCSGRGENT